MFLVGSSRDTCKVVPRNPKTITRGLSSNGTETYAKAETATEKAFQKAIFSLTETYQLALRLIGTGISNGISMVSSS